MRSYSPQCRSLTDAAGVTSSPDPVSAVTCQANRRRSRPSTTSCLQGGSYYLRVQCVGIMHRCLEVWRSALQMRLQQAACELPPSPEVLVVKVHTSMQLYYCKTFRNHCSILRDRPICFAAARDTINGLQHAALIPPHHPVCVHRRLAKLCIVRMFHLNLRRDLWDMRTSSNLPIHVREAQQRHAAAHINEFTKGHKAHSARTDMYRRFENTKRVKWHVSWQAVECSRMPTSASC